MSFLKANKDYNDRRFESNFALAKPLISFVFIMFFSASCIQHLYKDTKIESKVIKTDNCDSSEIEIDMRSREVFLSDKNEYEISFTSIKSLNKFLQFCRKNDSISIEFKKDIKNLFTVYNRVTNINGIKDQPILSKDQIKTSDKNKRDFAIISFISFLFLMHYLRLDLPFTRTQKITLRGKSPFINSILKLLITPILLFFVYKSSNIFLFTPICLFGIYILLQEFINISTTTLVYEQDNYLIIERIGLIRSREVISIDKTTTLIKKPSWLIGCKDKKLSYRTYSLINKKWGKKKIGFSTAKETDIQLQALIRKLQLHNIKSKKKSRIK